MSDGPRIGTAIIGQGEPIYLVAEIGINHNADVDLAKRLIDVAKDAGCDAVKLQKREPRACVPPQMWDVPRETPWGVMSYLEYRERMELSLPDWQAFIAHCRAREIAWFASVWDVPSVDFLEALDPPCHKVPSAMLTNDALLRRLAATGRTIVLSTGMSTLDEIEHAVSLLHKDRLVLLQSTSTYPCPPEELNLRAIETLRSFGVPVGYSGHERGLQASIAAAALGARMIERHITLDRAMWGSDHAASLEPQGIARLVRDVRIVEQALGDGQKRVYESERRAMERLRLAK